MGQRNHNANIVFIMLGNSCNMNCVYCLQHPLVNEPLSKRVNPRIYNFLAKLAMENSSGKIHLRFYGGEPLLYFPVIREMAEELYVRKIPATYSVITNGRALTDEMVDFFCGENFNVTVSWDGYKTGETRKFDVMQDAEIRKRILHLSHLGLSGVISAKAYPIEILEAFQEISDEYEDIHHKEIRINLDEIFDTGIASKCLLAVDYNRISHDMRRLTALYLDVANGGEYRRSDRTKVAYMAGFIRKLWHFYVVECGEWDSSFAACGNGTSVLNLDLDGYLYPCHNTSRSIGDITTPYETYMGRLLKGDGTNGRRSTCLACSALPYCKGGCKLVGEKARAETYCKLKRAMVEPVLEVLQNYGKK